MDRLQREEQKIIEKLDEVELTPFEEKLAQLAPQLEREAKPVAPKKRRYTVFQKLIAAAAAIVMVSVGAVVAYFSLRPDEEPTLRYQDSDIIVENCELEELTSLEGLYLPDLSLLDIQRIVVGRHIESKENVYFSLTTFFDDGISFCEIMITIVLKSEYNGTRSNNYSNLSESAVISGDKTIRHSLPTFIDPFFTYFVSYTKDNIRYYFHYKTVEENDLASFFGELLI